MNGMYPGEQPHGNKGHQESCEELVKSLDLMPKHWTIVLGGDFNLPGIDWDNEVVNPKAANKSQCELLLSSLDTHALVQIHKEPTN